MEVVWAEVAAILFSAFQPFGYSLFQIDIFPIQIMYKRQGAGICHGRNHKY